MQAEASTASFIRYGHTLRFVAPEVFTTEDERPKTSSADVYSFGMLLLQLRTPYTTLLIYHFRKAYSGEVPWKGRNKINVILAIANGEIPPRPSLPTLHTSIPDGIWELCVECWVKLPEHRPSMAEIVNVLTRRHQVGRHLL